jgi:hypothetical protein
MIRQLPRSPASEELVTAEFVINLVGCVSQLTRENNARVLYEERFRFRGNDR